MSETDAGVGREYTAEDLAASAAQEGLAASRKLIRNWVEEGLLDRPLVRGRGPRLGVAPGVWSENQRQLFLVLLRKRQREDVSLNAALANVPVWTWLIWGEDYVPTRQARRALRTWAQRARRPPILEAERSASIVSAKLSDRRATRADRRRFREVIARGQAGEGLAWEALVAASRSAIDPEHTGQPRGPEGAQLTPHAYGDLVAARTTATDALLAGHDTSPTDAHLERAAALYLATRLDYAEQWRAFSRDPDLGHLHEAPTAEALLNQACLDAVTALGLILRAEDWRGRRRRRKSGAPVRR